MSFHAAAWSRRWRVCAAVVVLGCGGCGRPPVADEAETWVTEPEFRIGDALEGDALFSWIPYLRATEDGRIFVLEPYISAVSVWDRDGEPVLSIGRPGQGPGDFVLPHRVHVGPDGFFVHEDSRFTFYADDGTLLRTAPGIPTSASFQGWPIRTLGRMEDGSWLGFPSVRAAARLGWLGGEPIGELPLLNVANVDGRWAMDTVYVVDRRNGTLGIRDPGGESPHAGLFTAQFFGDSDLYEFDPGTGTVLVVRRNTGVGVLEIVEVDAAGDTVWHRRLTFAPLELDDERIEQSVTLLAEVLSGGPGDISASNARDLASEALDTPEYLPCRHSSYLGVLGPGMAAGLGGAGHAAGVVLNRPWRHDVGTAQSPRARVVPGHGRDRESRVGRVDGFLRYSVRGRTQTGEGRQQLKRPVCRDRHQ